MRLRGEIRSIIYGTIPNKKDEFWTISVGTPVVQKLENDEKVKYFINRIEEDESRLFDLGYYEYNIYLSTKVGSEEEFLWKKYTKRPDVIQYYFEGESWV